MYPNERQDVHIYPTSDQDRALENLMATTSATRATVGMYRAGYVGDIMRVTLDDGTVHQFDEAGGEC